MRFLQIHNYRHNSGYEDSEVAAEAWMLAAPTGSLPEIVRSGGDGSIFRPWAASDLTAVIRSDWNADNLKDVHARFRRTI
jgi:hypothetical protein